jgi:hypothetical protein
MKIVNAKLLLQFDHFGDEGEVTKEMVQTYVQIINETLSMMHRDSQPQLFVNDDTEIIVVEVDDEDYLDED